MMGQRKSEPQLFNYAVNLEKRVRANHPLRGVKAAIDLSFVREEVAHCYGKNGNESVAPEVILKSGKNRAVSKHSRFFVGHERHRHLVIGHVLPADTRATPNDLTHSLPLI